MPPDPLVPIADALYAGTPGDFTEGRNAAAKDCDDKELARRVKALKKPSAAAWAVNLLVRRDADQIDQVLGLGESLRAAAESLDGDELRALTRQRRQLTTALASSARSLAREHGVRLSEQVVDQVEGVLNAAMLDPVAADVVRTGLVVTAFTSTGVSDLDVAAVVAVPEALGVRATPVEQPAPQLHVVPEDDGLRREKAQDAVDAAAAAVEVARGELGEVDDTLGKLGARRLQLQQEIEELRRRLADLEDDVDSVDEQVEDAEDAREEAVGVLEEASEQLQAAEQALAALER